MYDAPSVQMDGKAPTSTNNHGVDSKTSLSRLSAEHSRMLSEASGISDAVIAARGYRTASKKTQLQGLGFPASQRIVPALVLPVFNVHGELSTYQIRPDVPRFMNGRLVKYETPRGTQMTLDVSPTIREHIRDPTIPLFVTEGLKKADALASHDRCAIALLGVWNWRGANDKRGTTVLADFESVALNGRQTYIVFDSDGP